ncbi:nitroreductase family protein [Dorea acetigenes]|uniref:Nitroreductase family protein n=1 Tax=Dorea acetigenes TaxID=2981787 RepID=A0ABT2RQK1_9FIRM|nr:nitroreductase family protein [Dorea acetigenes]MCB6415418.1 nitroreductase family protein [Faecalimonas umbilicata]MCU6687705.1 nitroreductase family protein [Dorea acetigenes]SCJ53017.1 NADPH-flavin oxidoreductase [uncultured Clostridium sp.]
MELQACLENRRSIRQYKDTPVSREVIKELIEAAILAPSWKNSQVSRYYVADGEKKAQLAECLPDFNQKNVKDAPVLIVSAVVKGRSGFERDGSYSTHLKEGFQYFDNGLQVANLCLKAKELGLGTLVMGLYDEAAIREFFHIDDTQEIVSVISVGYPDIDPVKPKRKAAEEITVFAD